MKFQLFQSTTDLKKQHFVSQLRQSGKYYQHPTSQTSHNLNIPHLKHTTSRKLQIPNMSHPKHATSPTPHITHIHLPNIAHPEHCTSQKVECHCYLHLITPV